MYKIHPSLYISVHRIGDPVRRAQETMFVCRPWRWSGAGKGRDGKERKAQAAPSPLPPSSPLVKSEIEWGKRERVTDWLGARAGSPSLAVRPAFLMQARWPSPDCPSKWMKTLKGRFVLKHANAPLPCDVFAPRCICDRWQMASQ